MEKLEILLALNMVSEVKPICVQIFQKLSLSPKDIFRLSERELINEFGIAPQLAIKITSFDTNKIKEEFALIKKYNLKIITYMDDEYPFLLRQIYDPPFVLYVKGELKEKDKLAIAVVGARQASFYGIQCSQKFSYELADLGFTVVSGLARGIDTWAHKGALKAGGRTIAVLGSGFSFIYPKENKALIDEISLNGAVISEFPCNTRPLPFNFPRRNRIISGLSLGVLVVEASKKSGALITANLALEQNRQVFCIPGRQDSYQSWGTNTLIKEGAELVLDISDILEELNLDLKILR
ncbi:MAG: DNA-processing protein DprA [Candidatus Omnitrophica bacterium]|nr:DNA-processing protein DprA [Candidatus Omnitrophota bacterium]